MPFLHRQPFKLLYLAYFVTSIFVVKVPFWMLVSLPRSKRPRPSWSIYKCLCVYLLRSVMELPLRLGLMAKRDLSVEAQDHQLKNSKFVWVEGVNEENLQGELREYAKNASVKAARIPGYWQFNEAVAAAVWTPHAGDDEKVMYHLHGGALYLGTAHPSDTTARIPRGILQHSMMVTQTFAVDYRLCASAPFPAENPFPAGLLDCIAGYQYLLGLGFHPKNIILAGDSAGGNLALALLRYLTRSPFPNQEVPGKLLLLSPWGDLSSSRTGPTSSIAKNMASDIFPPLPPTKRGFGGYGVISYLGTALVREEARTNPYISPVSTHLVQTEGMFKGFPKAYVIAGGAERILDDSKAIAEQMRRDNPADEWVTLDVVQDAVHDFIVFPWHEPERSQALVRISRWIDQD